MMEAVEQGSACRIDNDAAAFKLSGPAKLADLVGLRREMVALAFRREIHRVLADLSCATLLMTECDWREFKRQCCASHAVGIPVGFLVHGPQIEFVRDYSDRMNAAGRVCLAFTSSRGAYRWLGVPEWRILVRPEEVAQG